MTGKFQCQSENFFAVKKIILSSCNYFILISDETELGCPKITPSVKCLAPEAFSGAKLQVFMENGQKNEID